jgi:hypothetical protein
VTAFIHRRYASTGDPAPQDQLVADLRRELDKTLGVLLQCGDYLSKHAEMNAALHCASDRVMYSPLHTVVTVAIARVHTLLDKTAPPGPATGGLPAKDED